MLEWLSVLGVLILLAFAGRYFGVSRTRMKRMPRTAIADLKADSVAKIVGRVQLVNEALEAPLTGTPCVCCCLTMFDTGSEYGGVLVDECNGIGTIRVEPLSFRIAASRGTTIRKLPQEGGGVPVLLRYLEQAADKGAHQGALAMLRRGWPMRVREVAVDDGATVALQGQASYRTDATGLTTTIFTCPDDAPLVISDDASALGI